MKSDLDHLMAARELDAVVVSGAVHGNPAMYYLTNGAGLTRGTVVKKRGAEPLLIAAPMEREEALHAGMAVKLTTEYDYVGLLQAHQGEQLATDVAYYQRIFADQGIAGRVGFYGMADQGRAFVFLRALQAALPSLEVVGEYDTDLLTEARATKDAAEVARIREVGRRTVAIVAETVAFLQQHTAGHDETLRRADGSVLNVGDVHAHIRRLIALQGLEDPHGFTFSTGRDAGIPHSKGTLTRPMRLGESIVFDIFLCEAGGGYFFDMTRTFCLGYAPEAVARIHNDVRECIQQINAAVAVGEEARAYQRMTCDFFRERGHPTVADYPNTLEGYVHTVSHGLGLQVHEAPTFRDVASNTARLQPGHVFTVEPGLYYPDEGMGCRLEDVLWIADNGQVHNLTEYPYELLIPLD